MRSTSKKTAVPQPYTIPAGRKEQMPPNGHLMRFSKITLELCIGIGLKSSLEKLQSHTKGMAIGQFSVYCFQRAVRGESHRKANTFLDTRQVRIMQRIARNQRPQRRQGRDHIDTDGRRPVESFCFSKHLRINQQPYKLILP